MVNHSQISSKLKHILDQNFHYTIQTNLLGEEGVSIDEKKRILAEQWQSLSTSEPVWVIIGPRLSPQSLYSVSCLWSWSLQQI